MAFATLRYKPIHVPIHGSQYTMRRGHEFMSAQILIVEDDLRLASLIREYLLRQGFEVSTETRGDDAIERIAEHSPDLVVLDLMLPGKDGLDVCREIRPHFSGPIMMLTARDEDTDQVVGLELGADDYVTKPVEPRVLLARIRALLRRSGNGAHPTGNPAQAVNELAFGQLSLDKSSRTATLDAREVELTTNEFELLWLLASHAGETLDRDRILSRLRGIGYDGMDRSVDISISRLRRKLHDKPEKPARIKTVRGKGYLFVADAW